VVTGRLNIPTDDGDLLHYSAVASEPLVSKSQAPAAEVAASSCLRRAAALAGLGLELWGQSGRRRIGGGAGSCWEGLGGYGSGLKAEEFILIKRKTRTSKKQNELTKPRTGSKRRSCLLGCKLVSNTCASSSGRAQYR